MKSLGILVVTLALLFLVTGFVMADPGVNATFETQGVSVATSIQATGNLRSMTHLAWSVSSGGIVSSGTDPTLAGYPNWDSYPYGEPTPPPQTAQSACIQMGIATHTEKV